MAETVTIKVSPKTLRNVQNYLDGLDSTVKADPNLGFQLSCGSVYVLTAYFLDGYEADIRVVSGPVAYVDPVLYNREGTIEQELEPGKSLVGDYYFDDHTVRVEQGEE